MKSLTGTGVALVTPFNKKGCVDYKALEKLVSHVTKGGVEYLVVLGTTGETPTLSFEEKNLIIDCVRKANKKKLPMVLGIGGNDTKEILYAFSKYDLKGFSAILSVTPYYNKPNQQALYQHFTALAAVSPLPLILYNVPGRTGVNMTAKTTIRLANENENIIAVKEASGNLDQIMQIIQQKPDRFSVISGDDNLTLPMIAAGASGVISVIANAYPKEYSDMVRLSLKNKFAEARELHYKLYYITQLVFEEGSPTGIKALLTEMKLIENHLRLPMIPASAELTKKIKAEAKDLK